MQGIQTETMMFEAGRNHRYRMLSDFSLEMTVKDLEAVQDARNLIAPRTAISITYLAGEHAEARLRAAREIAQLGFVPVPHISARRLTSRADLAILLDRLQTEAGVERVFIIAGDASDPLGPYADTLDVIGSGELEGHRIGLVGIAGYPEGHPIIDDVALWAALKAKHQSLTERGHLTEIVTQFGFDTDPVLAWLARLRSEGIESLVRIGVAGPANVRTLFRFATRCGVGVSAKVLTKYGISASKLLGSAGPEQLLRNLESKLDPSIHGRVKIHFYPFGGFARTAAWAQEFIRAASNNFDDAMLPERSAEQQS